MKFLLIHNTEKENVYVNLESCSSIDLNETEKTVTFHHSNHEDPEYGDLTSTEIANLKALLAQ